MIWKLYYLLVQGRLIILNVGPANLGNADRLFYGIKVSSLCRL